MPQSQCIMGSCNRCEFLSFFHRPQSPCTALTAGKSKCVPLTEGRARRLWKSIWYVFNLLTYLLLHRWNHTARLFACVMLRRFKCIHLGFRKAVSYLLDTTKFAKMKLLPASTLNFYRDMWKLIQSLGLSCEHLSFILISQVKSSQVFSRTHPNRHGFGFPWQTSLLSQGPSNERRCYFITTHLIGWMKA